MTTTEDSAGHDTGPLRILVPLDGSQLSARAAAFASRLPAAEIVLLHVARSRDDSESSKVHAQLEQIAEPMRANGCSVEVAVRSGDVSGNILDAAADVDLIVMSTHGRGAAGRLLFGSVADRISRHSATPTLLIRATKDDSEAPSPVRIVVPLDGSALAERALPMAITLARGMPLPLHLLQAVGLDEVRSTIRDQKKTGHASAESQQTYGSAREETERRAGVYLAEVAERLQSQGVEARTEMLQGTAAFALLWKIQPEDLVVMTSHGLHGFRRWLLGSVAEKLVREAKAPVLLIPTRERTV